MYGQEYYGNAQPYLQPYSATTAMEQLQTSTHHICQQHDHLKALQKDIIEKQRREHINSRSMKEHIVQRIEEFSRAFTPLFYDVAHQIERGQQLRASMTAQNHPNILSPLDHMITTLNNVRRNLISKSLLITRQPDPILQKGKPIETEVRLLLGNISSATVRIRIITISDAEMLKAGRIKSATISSQGTIENHQHILTAHECFFAGEFGNQLMLKDIGNRKKTNTAQKQTVTELKCVLLYEIEQNEELQRVFGITDEIWALSFPIILITHPKQLMNAYATIFWDRAFGSQESVKWTEFASLLPEVFACVSKATKRRLTEKDVEYLRVKMNVHNGTVSFHQFCKAKIAPRQQFTFWNWFYDCCQVIGDKMLAYWENGYIMDFLTRDDSMGILSSSSHPAFLLRFSDSELGVLALSFFINNRNGTKTPYQCLLNEPHPDKAVTLVALLRDFSSLRNIRYICMKNQELKDKKIFFDDKDLADTAGESDNVTPNGYHKVRLSLALAVSGEDVTQQEDQNEDQVEPTQFGNTSPIEFFSSPQAPQAVGSTSSNGFPCHHQQQQNGTASGYEPINNGNILTSHNSPCWNEAAGTSASSYEVSSYNQQHPTTTWHQSAFPPEQDCSLMTTMHTAPQEMDSWNGNANNLYN